MGFNWDDKEDDFRDIPDEVNEGQSAPVPVLNSGNVQRQAPIQRQATAPQASLPVVQDIIEEVIEYEEAEDDYTAVLADANLRIEQGTLYKMIMNHDLFDGLDVDQRAIDNVQREIRRFAKERMEIMLGMRQEVAKESMVSSPFNDLEVTILKKLASAASKGATESADANKTAAVVKQAPRKEGINTIGVSHKQVPRPAPVAAKKPVQALAGKPQTPIQRPAKSPVQDIQVEEEYKPLNKPIAKMTEDEIIQRNKEAAARQTGKQSVKSSTAIPQPSYEQQEMLHTQRSMENMNSGAVSAIVAALNKSKSQ